MELQDFIKCLKDKAIDHREYFHYTTVDKYLKMQTPVKLPDGETHRMLWLTPATATNDGMERKYGDHAYLGCFTYSPYESVGMWFMYGNPKKNAIRIGFDNQSLTEWRKRNINEKDHGRTIKAYGIDFDSNGVPIYHEIQSAMIEDVCLYDVAYVLSKEDVEHHRWPKSVEWRRDYHEVRSDNLEIVSKKGSLLYSNDFTDKTCSKLPFCFKKKGWSNEREVRLVVLLRPDASKWVHIAVPFDEPLECVDVKKKDCILLGPWHNGGHLSGVINEDLVGKSVFTGELPPIVREVDKKHQRYIVLYFDVLGVRANILDPLKNPHGASNASSDKYIDKINAAIRVFLENARKLYYAFTIDRVATLKRIFPDIRLDDNLFCKINIGLQQFSDTSLFYIEDAGEMSWIIVRYMLEEISEHIIDLLKHDIYLRGCIAEGVGWEVESNCLFGPVLEECYNAEQKLAGYQRIVFTDSFMDALSGVLIHLDDEGRQHWNSLAAEDYDGQKVLNYLSCYQKHCDGDGVDAMRKIIANAQASYEKYKAAGYIQLAEKYYHYREFLIKHLPYECR